MRRVDNPELDRLILDHLSDLYHIKEKREGVHLSTLIYCLTRSFLDSQQSMLPTDEEVMLFALGYGLQDVITPKSATTTVFVKNGITFSPDFMMKLNGDDYHEIKTTRMSSKKTELPETWLTYMMGGCYMRGVKHYKLTVLHMMGNYAPPFPTIHSETIYFDEAELLSNWDYLLTRKEVYDTALELSKPPTPYQHNQEWECNNCRYKLTCEALSAVIRMEQDE
ncbi:hypothetical protein LCGC14_1851270 [marine sediment metagenome]|uniref:PD-(D/E)XK endonuclease-like domain-containing protein n=1 Tax=marine sediment metagenome TaxID=412755 RepID=A0A0F9J9M6_9ZZZZ